VLDGNFLVFVNSFADSAFSNVDVLHGFVACAVGPHNGCHVVVVDWSGVLIK
jgi:hypothetical protein